MNTIFIKGIFFIFTFFILLYCLSYVKFEFINKGNILGSLFTFLFCLISVILGNIAFFLT